MRIATPRRAQPSRALLFPGPLGDGLRFCNCPRLEFPGPLGDGLCFCNCPRLEFPGPLGDGLRFCNCPRLESGEWCA
eukprot:4110720-Pyramimonas_sp.AAC.3